MKTYTPERLKEILAQHKLWLDTDEEKGSKADLRSADLRSANLRSANLRSADLRYADLRSANLRSANLRSADLRYADLRSANLRSADLRYADLRYADLRSAAGLPAAPVIENIDLRILRAINANGCSLEMDDWHKCETTHCRAGWAIHLAGPEGYALEKKTSPYVAGKLIYEASRPDQPAPNFFADNESALRDIRYHAKAQS